MKKCTILVASVVSTIPLSLAASTCGNGTLSSYVDLGSTGCTIGTNTIANVAVLEGTQGASEISPADILLSPDMNSSSVGLTAMTKVSSSAGSVQEFLFTYQLSGGSYVGSTIVLSKSSESGDGAVTGLQNLCLGGAFSGLDGVSGCSGIPGALATVDGVQNSDSSMFNTVNLLSVTDDLTVDGGTAGSATGGSFVNQFTTASTAVPEPISIWLTGIGIGIAAVRRFRVNPKRFAQELRHK